MKRIYKNPPIIEALCKFQFEPGPPWDWTIPGLFYREVESEFPIKCQYGPFQIGLSTEGQGALRITLLTGSNQQTQANTTKKKEQQNG